MLVFWLDMVHPARVASGRRSVDGDVPPTTSVLCTRRRCDHCGRWIARGATANRCPACDRVFHDECLGGLRCGVTAVGLRRSRRAGACRPWRCGKCNFDAKETAEMQAPHPAETPLTAGPMAASKRLAFEAVDAQVNSEILGRNHGRAASHSEIPSHHVDRSIDDIIDVAGGPTLQQNE